MGKAKISAFIRTKIKALVISGTKTFTEKARVNLTLIIYKDFLFKLLGVEEPLDIEIPDDKCEQDLESALQKYLLSASPAIMAYDPANPKPAIEIKNLKDALAKIQITDANDNFKESLKGVHPPLPLQNQAKPKELKRMDIPTAVTEESYTAARLTTSEVILTEEKLKEIFKRLKRLAATPVYRENRSAADCVKVVDDCIKSSNLAIEAGLDLAANLDAFKSDLEVLNQQTTRQAYTFLSAPVNKLRKIIINNAEKILGARAYKFLSRLNHGIVNIPSLINIINSGNIKSTDIDDVREITINIQKALAKLQVYPLIRASFKEDTNHISQPFTNLIEVIFECHILGYNHKSKIADTVKAINEIKREFVKLRSKLTLKQSALNELNNCETALDSINAVLHILENEYQDTYQHDNLNGDNFEDWAQQKLLAKSDLLKRVGEKLQSCPESAIDEFFIDPDHPSMLDSPADNAVLQYHELSHVVAESAQSTQCNAAAPDSFEAETANIIDKVLRGCKPCDFPPVIPKKSRSPIAQVQFLLFATIHCEQLSNTITLNDSAVNLFINPFKASSFLRASSAEAVTSDDDNEIVTRQIIDAKKRDLSLLCLRGYYKNLILKNGEQIGLSSGLGFFIAFKDPNNNPLGVLTCLRPDKKDCLSTAYGGSAGNPNIALNQAIDALLEREKQSYSKKVGDISALNALDAFHMNLKKIFLGNSLEATCLTRHHNGRNYSYLLIQVPYQVEDINAAKALANLLNENRHPVEKLYQVTDYKTLREIYHNPQPAPGKKLLAKFGAKHFIGVDYSRPQNDTSCQTSAVSSSHFALFANDNCTPTFTATNSGQSSLLQITNF